MTKILRKLLQLQRAPTPSCSATLCSHHPCRGWGFPSFQSGPTLGGQWGPQATEAWQAHPCPPFSNGAAQSPPPPSRGHHPHCRTLGSAGCQRGAKHPPVPSSCSSTSGALWEAGRSGNKKFMAKASQEAPSSCESATHRDPIEPQTAAASHSQHSHCSPASSPEQAASQQPGTHRNSPRTPLHPTAQKQFCCPTPAVSRAPAPRFGVWQRHPGIGTRTAPAWLATIQLGFALQVGEIGVQSLGPLNVQQIPQQCPGRSCRPWL